MQKRFLLPFFLILFIFSDDCFCQKYLNRDSLQSNVIELREKYGKNKKYPPQFELACLAALSYFPELKNISIEFKYKNIGRWRHNRTLISF